MDKYNAKDVVSILKVLNESNVIEFYLSNTELRIKFAKNGDIIEEDVGKLVDVIDNVGDGGNGKVKEMEEELLQEQMIIENPLEYEKLLNKEEE